MGWTVKTEDLMLFGALGIAGYMAWQYFLGPESSIPSYLRPNGTVDYNSSINPWTVHNGYLYDAGGRLILYEGKPAAALE